MGTVVATAAVASATDADQMDRVRTVMCRGYAVRPAREMERPDGSTTFLEDLTAAASPDTVSASRPAAGDRFVPMLYAPARRDERRTGP
jgi:hypothetical protein